MGWLSPTPSVLRQSASANDMPAGEMDFVQKFARDDQGGS